MLLTVKSNILNKLGIKTVNTLKDKMPYSHSDVPPTQHHHHHHCHRHPFNAVWNIKPTHPPLKVGETVRNTYVFKLTSLIFGLSFCLFLSSSSIFTMSGSARSMGVEPCKETRSLIFSQNYRFHLLWLAGYVKWGTCLRHASTVSWLTR